MRSLLVFFLAGISLAGSSQIVPDSTDGLKKYFEDWYKEAVRRAGAAKKKSKTERQVISLYLTAVNGYLDSTGNRVFVERAIPPDGKFSLVQNWLNYSVVKKFPEGPKDDPFGYSAGWRDFADSMRTATYGLDRKIEPLAIHPDKFRVPGLPLYEGKDSEIGGFLAGDSVDKKDPSVDAWRGETSRMVMGKRFEWVSAWIRLIEPHWGNHWIYRSFPIIRDIVIDEKAKQALLSYSIHNGGGYAYFKKGKSGWVLVESRITIMQ